ncbi:HIT family protein [Rhodococcus erythropolis]
MNNLDHLVKFRPSELSVYEGRNWIVTVRAKQVTLGDTVVLPKRVISTFSDATDEEAIELLRILGKLETVALDKLGAERVNAVAAMMKDPFVHFHFFPRYSESKNKFGQDWVDEDWPRAINLRDVDTPSESLHSVKSLIENSLADIG